MIIVIAIITLTKLGEVCAMFSTAVRGSAATEDDKDSGRHDLVENRCHWKQP
jgi:hypothetical protein